MAKHYYETHWLSNMAFEMDLKGHKVLMDASSDFGGDNSGPSPLGLIISAMTGCTGIDVASMLKKMRQPFEYLRIKVEAEMTDDHPITYSKIHLIYQVGGKGLKHKSVEKACRLSREKYCGVIAIVEKAVEFSYAVEIEDL